MYEWVRGCATVVAVSCWRIKWLFTENGGQAERLRGLRDVVDGERRGCRKKEGKKKKEKEMGMPLINTSMAANRLSTDQTARDDVVVVLLLSLLSLL